MPVIENNIYYNRENNWILSEARAFSHNYEEMLNANLQILDLNTGTLIYDIDDVWVYDWEQIK